MVWSSYASSYERWYGAAMRAVMGGVIEQLCDQLLEMVSSSYWRWYGAAMRSPMKTIINAANENDTKQLYEQLWEVVWSSYEDGMKQLRKRTDNRIFHKISNKGIESVDLSIINSSLAVHWCRKYQYCSFERGRSIITIWWGYYLIFCLNPEIPKYANRFASDSNCYAAEESTDWSDENLSEHLMSHSMGNIRLSMLDLL